MTIRHSARARAADRTEAGAETKATGQPFAAHGIGVAPGVVIGPALVLKRELDLVPERSLPPAAIPGEIARLEEGVIATRAQLRRLQRDLEGAAAAHVGVFDAHLMVLDDPAFVGEILQRVREEGINAEAALRDVTDRYSRMLGALEDDYLRERVVDIKDVARRLLRNLQGAGEASSGETDRKHIVVAVDLAPSETAALRRDRVLGFATDLGSPTSHTALMARALQIPAVVGLHDATTQVATGDEILIDGNKGVLIIRPSPEQLETYGRVEEHRRSIERALRNLHDEPAETRDGRRLVLSANTEGLAEIDQVLEFGAEGIGLFRSEYLFMARGEMVSEDEQTRVYSEVARRLAPQPVIIRTLDIGGDKYLFGAQPFHEGNPFLGCRSIRLSLMYPEQFKAQLRAILRASIHRNVRVMYPMIGSAEEVDQANAHLEACKQELTQAGVAFDPAIEVGVMIEIPSAALSADLIAKRVKFFSLGTNDLVQYTLAVDRVNERVAYLYQPTHPAIIKLIHETIEAGHRNGIWVGVCGQMAADPLLTPLLIGLGVDELSVAPSAVPLIKDAIRSLTLEEARSLAQAALKAESGAAVVASCRDLIRRAAPELLELVG